MNELQMRRNIHDGLHGLIHFTGEEIKVIDHPLFQRLRSICQTGLLKLVCPTSAHTRFEHSLGTVHMAQQMFDALYRESQSDADKLYGIMDATPGQSVRFSEFRRSTLTPMQRVLRLCALVHDLGHGPLSHAFEPFMPKAEDVAPLLDVPRLSALAPVRADLLRGKRGRLEHEAMSCILFAVIWNDLDGEPWIPRVVASVLLGSDPGAVDPLLRLFIPLIRDMISSAPIDADRMDYLLRDSQANGVCYGQYEPHRVLKSILCMRGADDMTQQTTRETYRLAWRHSGLSAIESFVFARYQMFAQIYYHKTWRATCLMLEEIGRLATASERPLLRTSSLDDLIEDFSGLSDETFLHTLRGNVRQDFPTNDRISALADQILQRKLWMRIYEFREDETDPEGFVSEMQKRCPTHSYILDRVPLRAMKDLERGAFLLIPDGRSKYSLLPKDPSWLGASSLMRALKEREQSLVRLFMKVDDAHGLETQIVKEYALELAAERAFSR